MVSCPKCGRETNEAAVICSGCDYILDVSFLGDDILNESTRDDDDALPPPVDPLFGGDSLILGDMENESEGFDDFVSEKTGDFLTAATSAGVRKLQPASVYIDAKTQALLDPVVVPRVKPDVNLSTLNLSPFETHLVGLIDGERPVARIQSLAGLSEDDFRIGIALVADKGILDIAGRAASASAQPAGNPALDDETLADPDFSDSESADLPADDAPLDLPFDALSPVAAAVPAAKPAPPLPGMSGIRPAATRDAAPPPVPGAAAPPLPGGNAAAAASPQPASPPAPKKAAPVRKPVSAADKKKAHQMFIMATKDVLQNRLSRARTYAKMAAELDPNEARYQALLDDWGNARAIAMESEGAPAEVQLFNEARLAERAGDYQKAVTLLQKALEHAPDAAQVHNQLGVVLATRLHNYTDALNSLFKAVELDSKNKSYKNNLGKILAMSHGQGNSFEGGGSGDGKESAGGVLSRFKKKLF